ncbi:MAG: ATP-binding protein [Dehalococcoidia bacterium]
MTRWHEKWLRRRPLVDGGEGAQRRAVLALVTIQDITQQRTLEESLRDIENRLRLALDVGEVGICAYDTAADEADLDERAASMLGLAAGRIDGATLRERVPSEDAPEDRHISGGSSLAEWLASEGEFRVVLPDGQLRWLHRRSTSVVPLDGSRSSEVLVTLRDVTARRRFEEAQQGFIAMASHELKNPLAALRGNAQLMLRRQAFDRDRTQAIVEQTRRLERLVRDLLDITVATTGRFSLMRAPADLMEITRQVVAERSLAAPEHRFSIRNRLPSVVGNWDADRVAQILDNLLSNAVKYSRAGSEIVVDVSTEPGECRVCVEDRGVGVSSAEQARIFERFYRTYPGAAEGLGLGLYVTRVLVEAHGGAIGVDSVPGQGSRFWFTLPWSPGLVTAREPPSEVLREARRGSGRVLVVDDDRLLRELIRDALATEGIAVETAATGAEATRALEQHRFDLLLLDLMLPDTTGERLALDLAHLGLREGLPILVISAAHGVQERAERLGAAGYLEKPFELDALIRAVSESLPNPSPEAAFA